jgi:hypothetical protein
MFHGNAMLMLGIARYRVYTFGPLFLSQLTDNFIRVYNFDGDSLKTHFRFMKLLK